MALLHPHSIPLPVATLYLVGSIIKDAASGTTDEPLPPGFRTCARPYARRRPRSGATPSRPPWLPKVHSLLVTNIAIISGNSTNSINPFTFKVLVTFKGERGGLLYSSEGSVIAVDENEDEFVPATSIYQISIVLKLPVAECLSPKNLRENLHLSDLEIAAASIPEDFEVVISRFEKNIISRYRQALSLGLLDAYISDKDCVNTPIPPEFWRRDVALELMTENVPTAIEIDSRTIYGHVFVNLPHLQMMWHNAFHQLPTEDLFAHAEYFPNGQPPAQIVTPWVEFLRKVADALGYVNGSPTRWDLSQRQIADYIERRWNRDELLNLGAYIDGMSVAMARLIVHPDCIKAGRRNDRVNEQRAEWQQLFEAEFNIQNNALANR